jgi:hypothetical protein
VRKEDSNSHLDHSIASRGRKNAYPHLYHRDESAIHHLAVTQKLARTHLVGIRSRERSRRLDRQEHDAITKRTAQKPVAQIKANRVVIDGVSNDCTNTCDLRHFKASSDPIEQQIRAKSVALVLSIDGQPADE